MSGHITHLGQPRRVLIFGFNTLAFYIAYVAATGEWAPTGGGETVWLWSAVSMWLLSLLAAPWFTPPRDAFAAAVTAGLLLATIDLIPGMVIIGLLEIFRWMARGCVAVIIGSALGAILIRNREPRNHFGEVCYRIGESLGRCSGASG